MAKCKNCGSENREAARFCRACGLPLVTADQAGAGAEGQAGAEPVAQGRQEEGVSVGLAPGAPAEDEPGATAGLPSGTPGGEALSGPYPPSESGTSPAIAETDPMIATGEEGLAGVDPGAAGLPSLPAAALDEPGAAAEGGAVEEAEMLPPAGDTAGIPAAEEAAEAQAPPAVDGPEEGEPASVPASPAGEQALQMGAVLQERYQVTAIQPGAAGDQPALAYEALDRQRCPSCLTVQKEPQAMFCEECGAEIGPGARVLLRPVMEASQDGQGEWILEQGQVFRVEPAEAPLKLYAQVLSASPPEPKGWFAGFATDRGLQRDINEDSLAALQFSQQVEGRGVPQPALFIVADGMGGHAAGEVASRVVVQGVAASLLSRVFLAATRGQDLTLPELEEHLKAAVLQSNLEIIDMHRLAGEADMGSTLTAALLYHATAVIANVGDSRTYLLRAGKLKQATRDHSFVAGLVEQGLIQPEEIYTHERRNVIYRSLGDHPDLVVDTFLEPVQSGDRLLLCSDGLWEMVHDPLLEDTLLQYPDPWQACDQLVRLANLAGGEDNISALVVNIQ